ncbi:MAG: TetR/AcrR family transcriptional regulator [Deltaproteobacteria bacterium]|nr:TetR/AcrR family transcriptional regulator [Deltaproteobacteria bacterium]
MPPAKRPPSIRRAPARRVGEERETKARAAKPARPPRSEPSRASPRRGGAPSPAAYHHGDLPNALVAAALELVRAEGSEALTLRAVARRAGVSEAAPYRHFADKDALLAAVAEQGFVSLRREMDAASARSSDVDTLTRLRRLGAAYVRFAVEHGAHFRVMSGPVVARRKQYPSLDRAANETFSRFVQALLDAQSDGFVAEGDIEELSLAAWAFVHGLAALAIEGHLDDRIAREESVGRLMARIAKYLVLGLGPRG